MSKKKALTKSPAFKYVEGLYKEKFGDLPSYEYDKFSEESILPALEAAIMKGEPIDEESTIWLDKVYFSIFGEHYGNMFPVANTPENVAILKKSIKERVQYQELFDDSAVY